MATAGYSPSQISAAIKKIEAGEITVADATAKIEAKQAEYIANMMWLETQFTTHFMGQERDQVIKEAGVKSQTFEDLKHNKTDVPLVVGYLKKTYSLE
jgi:hypothetical protein